jgi:hypothetical protein
MHHSRLADKRGIALVFAILALVVIGALVAGTFFVGRVEQVTGRNTVWAAQAGEAAEAGVSRVVATMDAGELEVMPIWSPGTSTEITLAPAPVPGMPGVVYRQTIRRLNNQLFLIRAVGERIGPGGEVLASQAIGQLVRIAKPTIGVNAAVTVQDPIKFNGNSFEVNGHNSLPPNWTPGECATGAPSAGNEDDLVGIRSSTTVGATSKELQNIHGYPTKTVEYDPTITSDTFRNFLDYTYATLSSQPGVKKLPLTTPYNGVGPVVDNSESPAVCDKAAPLNLGEPRRNPPVAGAVPECYNYFPITHGTGAQLKFASNTRGQGILLVDGNLELVGGFEWTGLIIVRGQMKITGTGNKIYGAILSEGVDVTSAGSIGGNAEVHYSACSIERAVQGASVPRVLSRGWSQLY